MCHSWTENDNRDCWRCGKKGKDYQKVYLPYFVINGPAWFDFDTAGRWTCETCCKELTCEIEEACDRWERKITGVIEIIE